MDLTAVGDVLYFSAQSNANGLSLWRSDGTDAGTVFVHNFGGASRPHHIVDFGGRVLVASAAALWIEELELLPGWTNTSLPTDVDGNGAVVALDAMLVINELNSHVYSDPFRGQLSAMRPAGAPFLDVNNNGTVEPLDAIWIINQILAGMQRGISTASVTQETRRDGAQPALSWQSNRAAATTLDDDDNSDSTSTATARAEQNAWDIHRRRLCRLKLNRQVPG